MDSTSIWLQSVEGERSARWGDDAKCTKPGRIQATLGKKCTSRGEEITSDTSRPFRTKIDLSQLAPVCSWIRFAAKCH
jgi:hypothetical protein